MSENHVKPFLYGQRNFWISGGRFAFVFKKKGGKRRAHVIEEDKAELLSEVLNGDGEIQAIAVKHLKGGHSYKIAEVIK